MSYQHTSQPARLTLVATEKYSKDTCGVVPRDRTKLVSGVGVAFGILAVIAFSLRITSKMTRAGGTFGLDDYAMMVAIVGFFSSWLDELTD